MSNSDVEPPQSLQMRALGVLDLTGLDTASAASVLAQPKRFVLLVHLAMAPLPYFRRRDSVVALFWPELDDHHARGALRQSLRFLRQALGADAIVARGLEEIGVSRAHLRFDVHEFAQAVAAADAVAALDAYVGDLLDGVHVSNVAEELESWIAGERARLRAMARDCARMLADDARARRDASTSAHWAQRAYALSNHEERDLVRVLAALAEAGDRSSAMQLYDEYAHALMDSMVAVPSPQVRAIVERIRAGSLTALPEVPPPVAGASEEKRSKSGVGEPVLSRSLTPVSTPSSRTLIVTVCLAMLLASTSVFMRLQAPRVQSAAAAIASAQRSGLPQLSTSSAAAVAYARGQNFLGKRDTMHLRMARDEFVTAIDADAAFADAWIGLSAAYANFAFYGLLPSAEGFARSDAAARRALTLRPQSGMARVMLAAPVAFQQWRWKDGERALRDAITLDSLQAEPHDMLANLLHVEGRFDEALVEEHTASRLDPLERHYEFQTGHILMCAGRYAEALEMARAALSLGSAYPLGHALASEALFHLARFRESAVELDLETGGQLFHGHDPPGSDVVARDALDIFMRQKAVDDVRELERIPQEQFMAPALRAERYAAIGNWPEAFRWLREGARVHDVNMKNSVCESDFWPVRRDPRFVAIMHDVGLPADTRGMH